MVTKQAAMQLYLILLATAPGSWYMAGSCHAIAFSSTSPVKDCSSMGGNLDTCAMHAWYEHGQQAANKNVPALQCGTTVMLYNMQPTVTWLLGIGTSLAPKHREDHNILVVASNTSMHRDGGHLQPESTPCAHLGVSNR